MSPTANNIDPKWAWQPFKPTASQKWTRSLAAHLYRRAAFGATAAQIDAAVKQSPAVVVEQIVRGADDDPALRRQSEELATTVLSTGDPRQLAAWWVYVMLATKNPLLERMTLFWHGHFATSADKVNDANELEKSSRTPMTNPTAAVLQLRFIRLLQACELALQSRLAEINMPSTGHWCKFVGYRSVSSARATAECQAERGDE